MEGVITEIQDLVELTRSGWDDIPHLQKTLVDIVIKHQETAESLGSAVANYSQAFVNEKETGYQMTIAEAEHRAKANTGGRHETLRAQLQSLTLLHQTVKERIDYLVGLSK